MTMTRLVITTLAVLTTVASSAVAQPMMDPLTVSGELLSEAGVNRAISIRVLRGAFAFPVVDHPVHLVAYYADGRIEVQTLKTGHRLVDAVRAKLKKAGKTQALEGGALTVESLVKRGLNEGIFVDGDPQSGRAHFRKLPVGGVNFYAMTLIERDGRVDRLITRPLAASRRQGFRMVLTGNPPDKPSGVDDLTALYSGRRAGRFETGVDIPPSHVFANLRFEVPPPPQSPITAELVALTDKSSVATTEVTLQWSARFFGAETLPDPAGRDQRAASGELRVLIAPSRQTAGPRPRAGLEVHVELEDLDAVAPDEPRIRTFEMTPNGLVTMSGLVHGRRYRVRSRLGNSRLVPRSPTFTYWNDATKPRPKRANASPDEVMIFTVQPVWRATFAALALDGNQVYAVRAHYANRSYTSIPFQASAKLGAEISLAVDDTPIEATTYRMAGQQDDDIFQMHLRILVENNSAFPYVDPQGGIFFPLPHGTLRAKPADEVAHAVKPVEDGVVWNGTLPAMGQQFMVKFHLPVEDGRVSLRWDAPTGLEDSELFMVIPNDARVVPIGDVKNAEPFDERDSEMIRRLREQGLRRVRYQLNVAPGYGVHLDVVGLPEHPWWHWAMKVTVGLLILGVVAVVFVKALLHARDATPVDEREESLLAELVVLEERYRDKDVDEEHYRDERKRLADALRAHRAEARDEMAEPATTSG